MALVSRSFDISKAGKEPSRRGKRKEDRTLSIICFSYRRNGTCCLRDVHSECRSP